MRWLGSPTRTPIGIDFGARYIKAAQLTRSSNGWDVLAATALPRAEVTQAIDGREVSHLRKVLERQGFLGNHVVLAVPRKNLLTAILEMPPRSPDAPYDQIARMELARIHRCSPESFEMAYWDLPASASAKDTARVMAAACPHAGAQAILDLFDQGGLDVQALDVPACAMARACEPLLRTEAAITCVLDIGWESARLFILYTGAVVYERALGEAGIKALSALLNRKLDLEPAVVEELLTEIGIAANAKDRQRAPDAFDDLRALITSHLNSTLEELRISFAYALHQYRDATIEQLVLIGGGAGIPGLAEYLGSALNLNVRVLAPKDLADCPPPLLEKCGNPALTISVGLAQFVEP